MSKVSIIIPSRNETYEVALGVNVLQKTVQDIYKNARGDFEVIVAFDGEPYSYLPDYPNLVVLKLRQSGTKVNINVATEIARGKYIFKVDAHCMFSEGFDIVLQENMQENFVVSPRMYILNAEEWKWQDDRFYDYFYLPCPLTDPRIFRFQAGGHWIDRTRDHLDVVFDENMKLHGSCFFMERKFFLERLKGLNSFGAGTWSGEDIEISLKTWLGPWDGRLIVNKGAWYAHMHKGGSRPRGWKVSQAEINASYLWTAHYWMRDEWKDRKYDLEWLIDRFYPVPTWPENWRELYDNWRRTEIHN